jgi:hypothetical protein
VPERGGGSPGAGPRRPEESDIPDLQDVCEEGRGSRPGHGLAVECVAGQEMIECSVQGYAKGWLFSAGGIGRTSPGGFCRVNPAELVRCRGVSASFVTLLC